MAKFAARLQARKMRKNGRSVLDIARSLGVSKGSVSIWCEDITLTSVQRTKLTRRQIAAGHKGRMLGAEKNRQKRLNNIAAQREKAQGMIGGLSERDRLMLGIALYWGEGVKARGSSLAIVNSDPAVIAFAASWFEQIGITRDDFCPCVFISGIHRPRERKILRFWSSLLGIRREQFTKTTFLKTKPKKIYENHDSYYGVLALRVRKGMTMKYLILGLIEECKENAGVAQLVRAIVS